ncbi:MAG: FHA domain-containing protein [Blautia sp.]|nr:FHA domain-containing protein [Blautia sp.]
MREIIRCPQGHYYDRAQYGRCPHCERGAFPLRRPDTLEKREISDLAGEYLLEQLNRGTVPVRRNIRQDDQPTVAMMSDRKDYFVTGWVVCVGGPDIGHSYNLHFGFNRIGQSFENEVVLSEDPAVARRTHCTIIYDGAKSNAFYLLPEEGCVTLVNGEPARAAGGMPAAVLRSGDRITLGKTMLEFIAFCRGARRWDFGEQQGRR